VVGTVRLCAVVREPNAPDKLVLYKRGVFRSCGTVLPNKCQVANGLSIPELDLVNGTGSYCYCTTDLCNGPAGSGGRNGDSDPPASVADRLAVGSIAAVYLLAWIAARFLGE